MTEQFSWAALDCGSSACRSPERARSGQRTNGGCRCHPEDVARAHERIAAQLRGTPSHAFEMREDARTIAKLRAELEAAKTMLRVYESSGYLPNFVKEKAVEKAAAKRGGA